jgi:putative ABC transport system permease protein
VIESFTLAIMGCIAGSIVALWLTQALVARLSTPFEYINYAIDVQAINPDLAIVDLRTMDQVLDTSAAQRRTPAAMLTAIGLLGLLLSALGLYGVIGYGYVVRSRAHELGIRLALGAQPADVRRLVLAQGFRIVGIGLAIGFAATFALASVMRSLISGFGALDPLTSAAVLAVLLSAGFAALYLPARRASSLDPAHTLRGE